MSHTRLAAQSDQGALGGRSRDRPRLLWVLAGLAAAAPFNASFTKRPWTDLQLRPLAAVAGLASIVLVAGALHQRDRKHFDLIDLCCLGWLVGIWLAALHSGAPLVGTIGAYQLSIGVLLTFAARSLVVDPAQATFILRALAVGCILAVALGLALWTWSSLDTTSWFVGRVTTIGREARFTRPWAHANIAALAIAGCGAAIVVLRNPVIRVCSLCLLAFALAATASRGGLLAGLVVCLVWIWQRRSRTGNLAILGLVAIVAVSVGTTAVWSARFNPAEIQDGYAADIEVAAKFTTGTGPVLVALTNNGTLTWQHEDRDQVLLSARWLDDAGSILAEDWWPLPEDIAVGDSMPMRISVLPRAPVGVHRIKWDLIIPNVLYFGEPASQVPVMSQVVVPTSSVRPETVKEYALARSQDQLSRLELWQLAWSEFNSSPLLGVGPNQFGQSSRSVLAGTNQVAGSHAHNIVLEPLVSWGLIGAVPFFVLFVHSLYRVVSQLRTSPSLVLTIILAGLLATLTHGLVDWPLVSVSTSIPIGIMLGLANSRGDLRLPNAQMINEGRH